MNKKSLFFGMAAFAIAALVFVGCDNGATEIEGGVGINGNKAPQVGAVTVTKTTNGQYFIVSWDAVAGDVDYEVLVKQDGKKTPVDPTLTAQNTVKYDAATGAESVNTNWDKWSVRTDSAVTFASSFSFGVRTTFKTGAVPEKTDVFSNVTWSAPETLTDIAVADVTLTKGTAGNFTVGFTKLTPPTGVTYDYAVILYEGDNQVATDYSISGSTAGAETVTLSVGGSYLRRTFTARVQITDAYYATEGVPYYDISKVYSDKESSAVSIGTTW